MGIGALPNKQKWLGNWLEKAKTEPFAFCDSTGPRLLLGRTRKRNVPKTLVYQDFLVKKINENDDVDDFVKRTTFRYNNKPNGFWQK